MGWCVRASASVLLAACYVGVPAADPIATTSGDGHVVSAESSSTTTRGNESSSAASSDPDSEAESSSSSTGELDTGTTMPIVDTSSGSSGVTTDCDAPMVAGTITETIDVDGVERTYITVVPESLDGSTTFARVIIGFHGTDGTAEHVNEAYGITSEDPALYVYPQALFLASAGAVAWDIEPEGNDFAFFDALRVDLAQKYCVDEEQTFAAGQSNGAFFVNELGCRRPETLRAIAPVAGGGPSWHPDCTSAMTVMMIHGATDDMVPLETGQNSREFWLDMDGCPGAASMPVNPPPCDAYVGCDEPVLWCVHGGGHEWPAFAGPAIRSFFFSL